MQNETGMIEFSPFNLEQEAYARMFNKKPPRRLLLVINGILVGGEDIEKKFLINSELGKRIPEVLSDSGNSLADPEYLHSLGINTLTWEIDTSNILLMPKIPKSYQTLRDWVIDGVYVQVMFQRPRNIIWSTGMGVAMMGYDEMVYRSKSFEPVDHKFPMLPPKTADLRRFYVGKSFSEPYAVWCRSLLDLRTRWLVTLWAMAKGRDPRSAYDNFRKAGGRYHWDYPRLCT